MIPYSVVLILVLGAHLVEFTNGQFNNDYFNGGRFPDVDWNYVLDIKADLQDGYLDYFDCTLKCFADVYQLSYINGDFCNGTFRLYSQDWRPVPFQTVVKVIECITVKCQTVVHKSVCDLSYDYPNDQYNPDSPLSAFNNPNYQTPAASDELNSLISGTSPQAATQNVPGSGADQLSQIGPQSVLQKKPSFGLKPQESSDSPFSTPFPLSDIMKQHLTKYGYKIPKSPSTYYNGITEKDTSTTNTSTTDSTTSTTESTTSTTASTTSTTESTTETSSTTTESTTSTTPSTTSSTTESTTTSTTESTTATDTSSTGSPTMSRDNKTNAGDLFSDATDISPYNLNFPSNSGGDNIRNPYYNVPYYRGTDNNGYPLGGSPENYPYNSENLYNHYFDYPNNNNYQQSPYNYRNPSYNPNLYTSKPVNIPGYQATGAQFRNLGNINNQPALNYNSNGQPQNILTPFSANWLKNSQTQITQGIQRPGTNNNLGNGQGVNQTPINQGDPGSSSFPFTNSKSQINQAPTNVGVPNSNSFPFSTSALQTNQAPNNVGIPGFGSFAFANSASQINGAPNKLGVPSPNSFFSANAISQMNQAPSNLGGAPGLNSYNFPNSGTGVNTAPANFGALGPNSYVNQQFRNQPLNNQGLQRYQVPNFFNQQNIPQNRIPLPGATSQSYSPEANKKPPNSKQNNKNSQNPKDNKFKIEYNDETYVLEKDGSMSVFKDNKFVRKLSPFK